MTKKKVMKLATRGKRFAAACIDIAPPMLMYFIVVGILAAHGINVNRSYGYWYDYGYDFGYGSRWMSAAGEAALLMISFLCIAYMVVEFVFYAKGKSIGKAILGMQVISSIDGRPFGFWKMVLRECIVKGSCGSVFFLGYIWILIDEKNRGWHDKILDSYVVDLKETEKLAYNSYPAPAPRPVQTNMPYGPGIPAGPAPVPEVKPAPEMPEAGKAPGAEDGRVPEAASVPEAKAAPAPEQKAPPAPEPEKASAPPDDTAAGISIESDVVSEETASEAAVEAAADESAEEAAEIAKPAISMAMKKDELLQAAGQLGVKVSSKATKAEIIEAITKASKEE